jgi:hypothetical protein
MFELVLLQAAILGVLAYCIWRSLKPEPIGIWSPAWMISKDAGHVAWSDEFNGNLVDFHSLNQSMRMHDTVGGHDFPRMELSEVSTRLWSSPSLMSASVDWMARKLTLWERFKIWFWKIRHFHWN